MERAGGDREEKTVGRYGDGPRRQGSPLAGQRSDQTGHQR